jgi:FMN reductase
MRSVVIVGIGGTVRAESSSEIALRIALDACARAGCETTLLGASAIALPFYDPSKAGGSDRASQLLSVIRGADGLIISSPGYHGGISGLVKNALDWLEELAHDRRQYLDGMPVGCISVANGAQGSVGTLASLRSVVHTLRGFPTPLGVAISATPGVFTSGDCADADVRGRLTSLGRQVSDFAARLRAADDHSNGERALYGHRDADVALRPNGVPTVRSARASTEKPVSLVTADGAEPLRVGDPGDDLPMGSSRRS